MLIVIGLLLLVKPAQAGDKTFVDNFIPGVVQNSIRDSFLSEVLASENIEVKAVDGSEASAKVTLNEVSQNLDTEISLKALGLQPGEQYIAIYHQNSDCAKEAGSIDKSIEGSFYATEKGEGEAKDIVKDSTNRIGSVSIRTAKDFRVVACGAV